MARPQDNGQGQIMEKELNARFNVDDDNAKRRTRGADIVITQRSNNANQHS